MALRREFQELAPLLLLDGLHNSVNTVTSLKENSVSPIALNTVHIKDSSAHLQKILRMELFNAMFS